MNRNELYYENRIAALTAKGEIKNKKDTYSKFKFMALTVNQNTKKCVLFYGGFV